MKIAHKRAKIKKTQEFKKLSSGNEGKKKFKEGFHR